MNIQNIVNGWNFRQLANVVIDMDTVSEQRTYKTNDIVFCKTDYIDRLFEEVNGFLEPITVITHCSDYEINKSTFLNRPSCIKKWFAQNANFQHQNLIPIPIGIENHDGPSKGLCIDVEFIKTLPLRPFLKQDFVYVNFGDTNSNRPIVREFLAKNHNCFVRREVLPSAEFHLEMSRFALVASPKGNGIDCHRTWEALLMGCIPIVEKHFMYDSWADLPIIQIDSWEELNDFQKFKTKVIDRLKQKTCLDILSMSYWENQIKND